MKRQIIIFFIGVLFLSPVISCTNSAPSCNDEQVKKMSIELYKDDIWNQMDHLSRRSGLQPTARKALDDKLQVSLANVRIMEYKKDIGTYICAGEIDMEANDNVGIFWKGYKSKNNVIYKTELVLDKKGEFRVALMQNE